VLPEADSEPHRFLLHPIKSGWQTIRVEYSQAGHPVAEVPVSIEVTNYDVPIVQQPVSAPLLTPGNAEPPELQLYITYFDPVLSFSLQRKGKARIDFPPLRIGSLEAFMEPRYRALDMLRETRTDSLALEVRSKPRKLSEKGANDRIQRLGRVIWQDLIPAELRAIYSRERESWKGRSLVIYSNETFVPWELLLPFDEMGGTWKDEEPWCTTMALTRWLRPPPAPRSAIDAPLTQPVAGSPPSELSLTNMGVVVPKQPQSAKLKAAKGEDAFLQRFRKQHRVRYAGVKPANSERVLTMLRDGKYDWLHAATHGNSLSGQFKDAPLWLEDDESITPDDMVDGDIIHALNERKPAFVLNACELGRGGWTLRATSAWAERLVPKGASLFIAPLWTVTDSLAMKFVTTLYERLAANETLAEAVRKARHAARKGADPTWLAYSVYGHPNAKLQVGSKATPDA